MTENEFREDTFQILIASDCHLGYLERDAERGTDSMTTFEEILSIANQKEVDFILLGGDLFHENKPSRKSFHCCMQLLRQYCMGDRPISIEFVSDQSENFKHSSFPIVNYEDPNLNISIPVFSIHGNHDDPAGLGSYCSLDLLSVCGLVNYFGKCTDLEHIQISPLLMQKGRTKLALYGLGSIRDERLHRLFREGKVSMLRPREKSEEWFNMFVLHQNRAKHGATNYIPEQFLDDFLDLVLWGHEHECRIKEEWNSQHTFCISQPGSSVATSLCHGEAVPKNVGLLQICGNSFQITEIPLQTVRQFYIRDIDLDNTSLNMGDPDIGEKVMEYCREVVDSLIERAIGEHTGHPKQPQKPLIRLRVYYSDNFETFSVQRFGQSYVDKVANPKDIINFSHKRGERVPKSAAIDVETLKNVLRQEGFDKSRVEDLVKEYFQKADETKRLSLLSETGVGIAVQQYVDKDIKEAINGLVEYQLKKTQTYLVEKEVEDSTIDEEIQKFKENRQKNAAEEATDTFTAVQKSAKSHRQSALSEESKEDELDDFHDDITNPSSSTRGRGRGRGRGRARGTRGRGGNRMSLSSVNGNSVLASPKGKKQSNTVIENLGFQRKKNPFEIARGNSRKNISSYEQDDSDECVLISDDETENKRKKAKSNVKKAIMYNSDSDDSV